MLTRPTEDETRKKKTIKYVCNSENDIWHIISILSFVKEKINFNRDKKRKFGVIFIYHINKSLAIYCYHLVC